MGGHLLLFLLFFLLWIMLLWTLVYKFSWGLTFPFLSERHTWENCWVRTLAFWKRPRLESYSLHRNERVLQCWKPGSGTPGWGRNSWAEEPFKCGDCLFLAHMTPAPRSAPKFLSTPVHLPHSRLNSYFWAADVWGVPGSAAGSGRGGSPSHQPLGTSIGLYFSRVVGGVYPAGFGSRHVCSEQVGQASPPAASCGTRLFGLLRRVL